ncbi:hypothetical protein [Kordia sp.]|uniref:hypothetical protein n=1 Tax=Kordia sp. TaxID=1965332 RepID=UPI003B5B78DF
MAILYKVKVDTISIETKTLIVQIESFHPDAMNFSENLGFAMKILYDSAKSKSTLSKFIDHECTMSETWMQNNVKGFISNCKLIEVRTPEIEELMDNGSYLYWFGETNQANAKISITVTNTAWIEHLSIASNWGSTAYDTVVDYKDREPINPVIDANSFSVDYKNSGGWIPVNGQSIKEYSSSWPVLYMPKYSEKSYRRIRKISYKNLTPKIIEELLFKTVFILERTGNKYFGTLVPYGENFGMLYLKSDQEADFYLKYKADIVTIGIAEFNTNDPAKVKII